MSAATPAMVAAVRMRRWRAGLGALRAGGRAVVSWSVMVCLLLGARWSVCLPTKRPLGRLRGACGIATGAFRAAPGGVACAQRTMEFRILGPLEVRGESGAVA